MATVELTEKATQSAFAELVGVSQPSIAERVKTGVLPRDGTYGEWLYLYCDQLRKEAAGRSGAAQDQLTTARIEESRENAAEKKQRRLMGCGSLVQLADVQQLVLDLPVTIRTQVMQAGEKIHEEIQAKYSIKLEDADVYEPLRSALRHVADRALQLRKTFGVGGAGADAQASADDSGLGAGELPVTD